MRTVDKIDFYVQSVLPSVYDDSLSFYELLNRVIEKVNELIAQSNEYFSKDLKTYVGDLLSEWYEDGTLADIINQDVLGMKANTADVLQQVAEVVTVGYGGQFATLNEALSSLSTRNVKYQSNGLMVEVRLKSGFIMQEQVILNKVDMGWIVLTSEAPQVVVNRDAITNEVADGRKPVFTGMNNAVLPIIAVNFILSAGTLERVDGVVVYRNSQATLIEPAAFKGFYRALSAYYSSEINYYRFGLSLDSYTGTPADFSGALDTALYATFNSKIGVAYGNFDNAVYHGAMCIWNSSLDVYRSTARNCGGYGFYARDGSQINARETNAQGCDVGYYALHRSSINARYKEGTSQNGADDCRIGVYALHNSHIDAEGMSAKDCSDFGLYAGHSSKIECRLGILTGCGTGAKAECNASINVRLANLSGCGIGVEANEGSTINAYGANLDNAGNNGAYAHNASTIEMEGATAKNAKSVAVLARGASRINAQSVTATGATIRGANAAQGSLINAMSANFRMGAADAGSDLVVYDGGQIIAVGATGGMNVTEYTVTTNGIIFK